MQFGRIITDHLLKLSNLLNLQRKGLSKCQLCVMLYCCVISVVAGWLSW